MSLFFNKFLNNNKFIVLFLFTSVVIHYFAFLSLGPWLHWADPMIYVTATENMLKGESFIFPKGYYYGGFALTWIRTVWVFFFNLLSISNEYSHYFFTFIISPFLFSVSSFYAARVFFSRNTSFIVGLTTAIGFKGIDTYLGLDFFIGSIILSNLIIILRGHCDNPLIQLSKINLTIYSFICGLSIYNWKASILVVLSLTFPWAFFISKTLEYIQKFNQSNAVLKFIFTLIYIFLFITLYLSIFRGSLGTVLGKDVKIFHLSFLIYTAILVVIFYFLLFKNLIFKNLFLILNRFFVFILFFLLGYLPQIYFNLTTFIHENTKFMFWASMNESYEFLRKMPLALQGVFLGSQNSFYFYNGIEKQILFIFIILGFLFSFRLLKKKQSFLSFYFLFLLNSISFLLVYNTASAEYRYFFPSVCALLFFYASFWEYVFSNKKLIPVSLFFLFLSFVYQWNHKVSLIHENNKNQHVQNIHKTHKDFLQSDLKTVVSTNINYMDVFNLIGGSKPQFYYGRDIIVHPHKYHKDIFTGKEGFGLVFLSMDQKNIFLEGISDLYNIQFISKPIFVNGNLSLHHVQSIEN